MSTPSSVEIARRIRDGNEKRRAEERKRQQLEQEYQDAFSEKVQEAHQRQSATRFLPSIFIFLIFVSFPLSDQVVDWGLVAISGALNVVLAAAFTNSSDWVSLVSTVLINFFLVRFSDEVYVLPERLMQVPPVLLLNYVAVNALILVAAYMLYVNPRFLGYKQSESRTGTISRRLKPTALKSVAEEEALAEFAVRKAEAERLDLLLCLLLLLNIATLIYLDVIPLDVVLKNGWNTFRLLN